MTTQATKEKENAMDIRVVDGKPYALKETSLFRGYAPIVNAGEIEPVVYKGAKINLIDWWQAINWMKAVYDRLGVECQLRMIQSRADGRVYLYPWPQEYSKQSALTTKEIPDGDLREEVDRKFPAAKFMQIGDVHHHCGIGASQSSTDYNDEIKTNGLHITIGYMNRDNGFDIHGRVTYGGRQYAPDYGMWFMTSKSVDEFLAECDNRNTGWELILTNVPDAVTGYPEEWDNMLVERKPHVYQGFQGNYNNNYGHGYGHHFGYGGMDDGYDDWWERRNPRRSRRNGWSGWADDNQGNHRLPAPPDNGHTADYYTGDPEWDNILSDDILRDERLPDLINEAIRDIIVLIIYDEMCDAIRNNVDKDDLVYGTYGVMDFCLQSVITPDEINEIVISRNHAHPSSAIWALRTKLRKAFKWAGEDFIKTGIMYSSGINDAIDDMYDINEEEERRLLAEYADNYIEEEPNEDE